LYKKAKLYTLIMPNIAIIMAAIFHGFCMLWANVFEATKEPSTMLAGSGKEKRQRMEAALGAE